MPPLEELGDLYATADRSVSKAEPSVMSGLCCNRCPDSRAELFYERPDRPASGAGLSATWDMFLMSVLII
jgi:hypothetical protein